MSQHHGSTDPAPAHVELPGLDVRELHRVVEDAVRLTRGLYTKASEDDVQDGALKWWSRLASGRIPVYLVQDGRLSASLLAYWILRSADDRRCEREIRETRLQRRGYRVVSVCDAGWERYDSSDPVVAPLAESVVERIFAGREIDRLGPMDELDEVLRLRALGLSYEEIGERLGITPGAARIRRMRVARRIAARLDATA